MRNVRWQPCIQRRWTRPCPRRSNLSGSRDLPTKRLDGLAPDESGGFRAYDGQRLPWGIAAALHAQFWMLYVLIISRMVTNPLSIHFENSALPAG